MNFPIHRRTLLLASATLAFLPGISPASQRNSATTSLQQAQQALQAQLEKLEADLQGRIGLFAIDSARPASPVLAWRAEERFAFCSTFKAMLAAAVLARSIKQPDLLTRRIRYKKSDLISHSPITKEQLAHGMTVQELCAATMQYSDNCAANLLIDLLGGPASVTAFARSIGDQQFRLDRREPELNSATPGDVRDTTTPQAMAHSLQQLALGNALAGAQRQQFVQWLRGNTTGDERIRAGVPGDWQVGDKTGTGPFGIANDIAVLWPPGRAPVVLTVFTAQATKDGKTRNDVVAAAARIVVQALA
ncbi:MAG: hypothetical protein RL748_1415 [Pseudomonadota bacterium]|jgi:beta-lactamase class A